LEKNSTKQEISEDSGEKFSSKKIEVMVLVVLMVFQIGLRIFSGRTIMK